MPYGAWTLKKLIHLLLSVEGIIKAKLMRLGVCSFKKERKSVYSRQQLSIRVWNEHAQYSLEFCILWFSISHHSHKRLALSKHLFTSWLSSLILGDLDENNKISFFGWECIQIIICKVLIFKLINFNVFSIQFPDWSLAPSGMNPALSKVTEHDKCLECLDLFKMQCKSTEWVNNSIKYLSFLLGTWIT